MRCASFKPFWPPALVQQALPAIILAALRRFRGSALFLGLRSSSRLGAPFWPSGLTVRRSRPPTAAAELSSLVPSPALCRPLFIPGFCLSQRFLLWGLGRSPGFACGLGVSFKPFGPLALASQAPAAIILAALRRLRGAALFPGQRPSSSPGAPFWPSGLTVRRSRPPTAAAELRALAPLKPCFISPMLIQTAFNFSSAVQRWVCRFSGLRLVALRWFVVFLASSPCVASASSYRFCSAAPPRWRCAFSQFVPVAKFRLSVLASGSNLPVKPTRILRSAYLAR